MKICLKNIPPELEAPLKEIAPSLQFSLSNDGLQVTIRQNDTGPAIVFEDDACFLEYHKKNEFFRALSLLPERIKEQNTYCETPAHNDLCLMSDCSRNAVYNVPAAKRMIRYLALMGFNSFMLYTEDTYEVPEYPYFGYMRGRFSQQELKDIDDYAFSFGIEMIPCIQVLAHLEGSLRWPDFQSVIDNTNILLVGEEKTYALIEAMIQSCRACFRSNRIHVGMDEAHLLGSGKYLDINGYRDRSSIILEHLDKIVKICEKYQFNPMIWSDMFFRIQFHTYYVDKGEISNDVINMVPENLSLVYWDYYSDNEKRFRHMMHCHQQFRNPTIFAGGAWKWYGMSPMNFYSLYVNDIHLRIAREEKVSTVIATAWGDNGAEASNFSILPTLQQYAEYCYAKGEDLNWVKARFFETFGVKFDDFLLLDSPNLLSDTDPHNYSKVLLSKYIFYNDPLGGWIDCKIKPQYADEFAQKAEIIAAVPENPFSYMLHSAEALCRFLALKATLSTDIRTAYLEKNIETLRAIAAERIPAVLSSLDQYLSVARNEWYYDNKTFGFDVIELRIGGLKERLNTTKRTIEDFIEGKITKIEQLDVEILDVSPKNVWRKLASGNII